MKATHDRHLIMVNLFYYGFVNFQTADHQSLLRNEAERGNKSPFPEHFKAAKRSVFFLVSGEVVYPIYSDELDL